MYRKPHTRKTYPAQRVKTVAVKKLWTVPTESMKWWGHVCCAEMVWIHSSCGRWCFKIRSPENLQSHTFSEEQNTILLPSCPCRPLCAVQCGPLYGFSLMSSVRFFTVQRCLYHVVKLRPTGWNLEWTCFIQPGVVKASEPHQWPKSISFFFHFRNQCFLSTCHLPAVLAPGTVRWAKQNLSLHRA